jgi:hypothetical protein
MLKVIGVDSFNGRPRSLVVKTNDERKAWRRAESKRILPRKMIRLRLKSPEPRKPDRSGVVYLARAGEYFKIGKSTNPQQRYERLQIQLPYKLQPVHEIITNDVDYTERHWHRRFAAQRCNGEWFALSAADVHDFTKCKRMIVDDG